MDLAEALEELERLRNLEYVAVEDITTNEIEVMTLDEAKENFICLRNDDEDYQPTESENEFDMNGVMSTKRIYYTLSKLQPKKVEFLYAKEPTFLNLACLVKSFVHIDPYPDLSQLPLAHLNPFLNFLPFSYLLL